MSPTISPEERALQAQVFAGPQPEPEPVTAEPATVLFTGLHPERPPKRHGYRYEGRRKFNPFLNKPKRKPDPPKAESEHVHLNHSEPIEITAEDVDEQKAYEQERREEVRKLFMPDPEPAKPEAKPWASLIEQLQEARSMCKRFQELADEMIELVQGRAQ